MAERIGVAAAALIVVFVGWYWWQSLVPSTYSVMDMGIADFGGGPEFPHPGIDGLVRHAAHDGAAAGEPVTRDVSSLTGDTTGVPDVQVQLTAREETTSLADGAEFDGYTLNGSTPGPLIRARQGDLVEVRFRNDNVEDGATLHWHGLDVPNAMDGVAGITQDAVGAGDEYTYRFVADEVGTYWYHSHQVSHEQVIRGLYGTLVVDPRGSEASKRFDEDVVAAVHTYNGVRTINGTAEQWRAQVPVGSRVRLRVVNTDNGQMSFWVPGTPFRLLATDGHEITSPQEVRDVSVALGAGGRADIEVRVPPGGVRVQMANASILLGAGEPAETSQPEELDLLDYGKPSPEDDELVRTARANEFDREFEYAIGRRPGVVDGKPGVWWTINGKVFPEVPMFMVREGDLVRMTISNNSGSVHPMHLHGHRITVLSRDGEPVTGSAWQGDSLNVRNGETFEIAFVADNPGVWMDHCHNLDHAKDGLIAHVMYEGVATKFLVGGHAGNHPE